MCRLSSQCTHKTGEHDSAVLDHVMYLQTQQLQAKSKEIEVLTGTVGAMHNQMHLNRQGLAIDAVMRSLGSSSSGHFHFAENHMLDILGSGSSTAAEVTHIGPRGRRVAMGQLMGHHTSMSNRTTTTRSSSPSYSSSSSSTSSSSSSSPPSAEAPSAVVSAAQQPIREEEIPTQEEMDAFGITDQLTFILQRRAMEVYRR